MGTKIRRELWLGLYGAGIAVVLAAYFQSFPIPGFLSKVTGLFSGALLVAVLLSLGRLVKELLERTFGVTPDTSLATRLPSYLALGSIGVGVLVLALGTIVPGDLQLKLRILLVLLVIHLAFSLKNSPPEPHVAWTLSAGETGWTLLAGGGVLLAFAACFGPITYYDSLVYHLALPSLYLKEGAITTVSFNLYSAFPAAMEMVFMLALAALPEPEIAINLLGWSLTVATGAIVANWTAELTNRRAGFIAHAVWWTMPAVLLLSHGAYVDVPLAFLTVLAIRSFYRWKEEPTPGAWLALAGVFSGGAFAIKYTGGITGGLLIFVVLGLTLRRKAEWKDVAIFFGSAAVPVLPWLIKNAVTLGNPVFPFLHQVFGVGQTGWTEATASGYFQMLTEYGTRSFLLFEMLLAPWRIATTALSYGGGFDVLGDFGWPLVLFSAPLAFLWPDRRRTLAPLGFFALAGFLFWLASKPVLRFLIPFLPVFTLLTACACEPLLSGGWLKKTATGLVVGGWTLSHVFLFFFVADSLQLFRVPLSLESSREFLERRLPYYPLVTAINRDVPREKVFVLGEQRTYHFNGPVISSNIFAPSPIAFAANTPEGNTAIQAYVREQKIGLILVAEGEIQRLGGLQRFGFSRDGEKTFLTYLSTQTKEIAAPKGFRLYKS